MRLRFAVLASVLAACAAGAAPGVAGAAPKHNHGLTINVTPNPIISGEGVLIYGQLKGTPIAGQTISLYHRVNPQTSFTLIGTTTTDTFGFYEFSRAEGVVTTNRNWFVTGPNGTHSRTVHERVGALVSITASSTTALTGKPITFTGQVTPNHAFARVFLQEQVGTGDSWRTLTSGRLDAGSAYSLAHRWATTGPHDVRVVFRGDGRNIAAASDPVTVSISQAQVADFTINTSAQIIDEGAQATISGTLDSAGTSTGLGKTMVTLWSRTHGQAHYRALQSTTTADDGSYSFTVQPTVNTVYVVRTTLPANRHTAALYEGVRDVLQMQASATTSTVGGVVTFSGSVTPDKAGHRVYLQHLGDDGRWHDVEVTIVRPSSTFAFAWRFGKAATHQFRARIYSDGRNVGTASAAVAITVSGAAPSAALPPAS